MAFTVGMKVVLVGWGDNPTIIKGWIAAGANYPKVGEVYTIRAIKPWEDTSVLLLEEIRNEHLGFDLEPGIRQEFFRPVVSPKVSVSFTTGAGPQSDKWDNRRPVEVHTFNEAEHQEILQYLLGFY